MPGALILERLKHRSDALSKRVHAAGAPHEVTNASPTGIYPGIAMRPTIPTGQLPTSVVAGDFNKDGHIDFIIANADTDDLWFYAGKGDGTFQLPRIIPLSKGLGPIYLASADLRNSGNLDLVVAEFDTSTVGVLLNNGDGTFGYEKTYALTQPPGALVVDDFNHDGRPDIAVVMQSVEGYEGPEFPYIAMLAGDGTGAFAIPVVTANPGFNSTASNLASGDINGDGLPDLLITGPGQENSQVFLNGGDGTFKAGATVMENLPFILLDGRLGDVDGDGCIDAIVADATTGVWVALGDCSGNFTIPQVFPMGDSPAAVRLADINGDGVPDLVTTSTPVLGMFNLSSIGNTLDVAFGDGKGSFGLGRTYQGPGESLSFAVADFNADAKADVITVNNDTASATLYLNDGSGSFGFPQGVYSGVSNQGLTIAPYVGPSFADLNGDGKTDAFFVGYSVNTDFYAFSYANDGTGRFASAVASAAGVVFDNIGDYRLGDFRNSGRLDLVAIGQDLQYPGSSQHILFMPGNGDGTFGKATIVTPNGADGLLTTADFDRDGKLDFVTVNGRLNHTLTSFLGNGDGTFRAGAPITFSDANGEIGRVYSGDFNHDGKMGVLVFTTDNEIPSSPGVWEFLGKGDGTFQPGKRLFTDFEDFALMDLNGDGCPDIAQYDLYITSDPLSPPPSNPATFTNFLCQADGSFSKSSTYSPYAGTYDLLAQYTQFGDPNNSPLLGDFNSDGKLDEVAWQDGPHYSRYLQMLSGNGDGKFTPTYDIFPRYILNSPYYSRDLDRDGSSDLFQLSILSNSINVIKAAPAPALQLELEDAVVTGNQGCGWVFPNVISGSDRSVALSTSISAVSLPASVTIPANAGSARFCYTLPGNFEWRQVFDINAKLNGDVATQYASDSYILGFDEQLSPVTLPPVYSGESSDPITVSVKAASGYGSTVNLSCHGMPAGDTCRFDSTTLDLSSGGTASATVTLMTGANIIQTGDHPQFTIVADDGNITRQQTIGLYVADLMIQGATGTIGVAPGASVSLDLQVFGIPPYSLSCPGLPQGATCSFAGSAVNYPNPSFYGDTIALASSVAPGSYSFQINVTSGSHTASISETLNVIGLSVQGPPANSDWVITGTTQSIPVSIQLSSSTPDSVELNCSLDVTATCVADLSLLQPGTQTVNLALTVPSGTATGQHQLTLTAGFNGTTQTFNIPVAVVALSGTFSSSNVAMARNSSASLTATLNATAGFVDSLSFACNGADQITCSFNPKSVQLTGGTAQTVTITLTSSPSAETRPGGGFFRRTGDLRLALLLPTLLIAVYRKKWRRLFVFIAAFCMLESLVSCGGGGGTGGGGGGGGSGGGGTNSYSVTVIAAPDNTKASITIGKIDVTVSH